MSIFDDIKNTFNNEKPEDKIKKQIEAAGVDTSELSLKMSGATLVVSGTVETESQLKKLEKFIEANSQYLSIKNNAEVADEEEEDDEEEDDDDDDEDYIEIEGRQLQTILHALGYTLGHIDGIVGQKTKAALKKFQKDYELDVTGEVDDDTNSALRVAFRDDLEEMTVLVAQLILDDLDYSVGGIDGIMGPKTKLALRNFQADNDLDESGKLDDDTIEALVDSYV
jgi:hypothetical protein